MRTRLGVLIAVLAATSSTLAVGTASAAGGSTRAGTRPHDAVSDLVLYREGENRDGQPLELDLYCQLEALPEDDSAADASVIAKAYLPHKLRVRGRMRRIELGGGDINSCDEVGQGGEGTGYFPWRSAIDFNPDVAGRGSGRDYIQGALYQRVRRLVRRAHKLQVAIDLEHDGFRTRVKRTVPFRGWTADCFPRREGRVRYDSYTPDGLNHPPTAWLTAYSAAPNRCVLSVLPGNRLGMPADPEGDWVSLEWSVAGQLVRPVDPPADPNAEDGPYAERGFAASYPLDNRRRTVRLRVFDQHGAWGSASYVIQPHSTRIKASRWPYG